MRRLSLFLIGALCWGVTGAAAVGAEGDTPRESKTYICPPCGCTSDDRTFDKPGNCPSCRMQLTEKAQSRTYNVAIVVFEGVELLDFAGPGEVFEAARYHSSGTGASFNVYTVAPSAGKVVSQRFLTIEPQYSIENAPAPDVLVIPGGNVSSLTRHADFMKWARSASKEADITLSVCNGVFVPAEHGELNGKKATTHRSAIRGLRDGFSEVTVVENTRFVDEEEIVTAAGVSAGIDGALHVVARLASFEAARSTAHYMEYEWNAADKTRELLNKSRTAGSNSH